MKFKKYSVTSYNADTVFCSIALVLGVLILAYARNNDETKTISEPWISKVFLEITVFGLKLLAATACVILPIVVYDKVKNGEIKKSS